MTNMFSRPVRAIDILLADVVQKIQLSPTNYDLAVARYKTIADWLDRDGSPLQGRVSRVYAQGSMAMRATISSQLENDEFDIDIMAELDKFLYQYGPRVVLDLLFHAINGEPGSRYHGMVVRNTRCVTINYTDMHLDMTPAFLLTGEPRTSHISHSKTECPISEDHYVMANPWGFADWFMSVTPAAAATMETMVKAADAEPVPERPQLHERSLALMSLQLLKRWRNKRYDQRDGRWPPSILLARLVGEHADAMRRAGIIRYSLHEELSAQAAYILTVFESLCAAGTLIHRTNPRCEADIVTDRWPGGSMSNQQVFLRDLRDLNVKLRQLDTETGLDEKRVILADLFGERVTGLAFDEYQKRLDDSAWTTGVLYTPRTGAIQSGIPAALTMPGRTSGIAAPSHTSFGGIRMRRPWKS